MWFFELRFANMICGDEMKDSLDMSEFVDDKICVEKINHQDGKIQQ